MPTLLVIEILEKVIAKGKSKQGIETINVGTTVPHEKYVNTNVAAPNKNGTIEWIMMYLKGIFTDSLGVTMNFIFLLSSPLNTERTNDVFIAV
nr:hypothetical protein [Mycoplasmopsis bovis]